MLSRSGSVISAYYSSTPSLAPAASTSLASLLHSIETSWSANPTYTSAELAIISAGLLILSYPTHRDTYLHPAPTSIQASLATSGWDIEDISTQAWYTKNVPKDIQSAINAEVSALDSAAAKIIGTPSTSMGLAPMATAGFGVAGVIGVFGAVAGAVL